VHLFYKEVTGGDVPSDMIENYVGVQLGDFEINTKSPVTNFSSLVQVRAS
jgi:hypothetical protein